MKTTKFKLSNLLNSFSILTSLFLSSTVLNSAKAEEAPPTCVSSIGSVSGGDLKTAAQIASADIGACLATPSRFEIDIYEMGLCTANPISGTPKTFSKSNCIVTMTSSAGVTADLASATVNLPSSSSRPSNGSYDYAYISIGNTIGLKGSINLSDGSGGTIEYFSNTSGGVKTTGSADNHSEEIDSFDDSFDPDFGPSNTSTGAVSAILTDNDLVRATSAEGVTRLVGVFNMATNSGTPVVISNSSSGLEVQLQVTDGGYSIMFNQTPGHSDEGKPEDFGSAPFKPLFTVF